MNTLTHARTASSLLSVVAALAAGLSAQKVGEIEPNDSPATAMPITAGMHITASYATTTDDDWYSFTLAQPGQVHLHTVGTGTLSLPVTRDNRIAIYDATGTVRLTWNDATVGLMADCGATLPAGSYKAVVNLKAGTAAAYDLDFFVLPAKSIDTFEAAEPNGATGVPTPFRLGDTIEGAILPGVPADEDFWSFTLPTRGIVVAATYDDGGVPQLDNVALRLYSGIPGLWTAIGGGDATNAQSHRVTTLAHPGILDAGTYAISVKAGSAAAGSGPWDYAKTGKYSLRTSFIDLPDSYVVQEWLEPNNSPATLAGRRRLRRGLQRQLHGQPRRGLVPAPGRQSDDDRRHGRGHRCDAARRLHAARVGRHRHRDRGQRGGRRVHSRQARLHDRARRRLLPEHPGSERQHHRRLPHARRRHDPAVCRQHHTRRAGVDQRLHRLERSAADARLRAR
jgi:hypothetical protein